MSLIVHLDSTYRDPVADPKSTQFKTYGDQIATWIYERKVSMNNADRRRSQNNPFHTVNIKSLVLPYNPAGSTILTDEAMLFINIDFQVGQGLLLNSNNPNVRKAKIVCEISNIQFNAVAAPIFVHYRPLYEQTMLVDLKRNVELSIYLKDGSLVNIVDPALAATPSPISSSYTSVSGSYITVASIVGIIVGQSVRGDNITAGTTVTTIGVPGPNDIGLSLGVLPTAISKFVQFYALPTPSLQTQCVLEITPYQRDGTYSHLTEPDI